MKKVFISYRREDTEDATGRIHDHLKFYFGNDVVFRDIDNIRPGEDFSKRLDSELADCGIIIVVIGSRWLTVKDDNGGRRLDNPADYVRMEVEKGLALRNQSEKNVLVIPLFVGRSGLPNRNDLPPSLKPLLDAHALQAPPDVDFPSRMRYLSEQIARHLQIEFEDYRSTLDQCQRTGLTLIAGDFGEDRSIFDELKCSKHLLVVQNDGRSWIDHNRERILGRLSDTEKTTKVILYHPKSDFLPIHVRKKNVLLTHQISEIRNSVRILTERRDAQLDQQLAKKQLQIRGHYGFNPYSLLISDKYAFVSTYHYQEAGKLPLFKFARHSREPMYETLRLDAEKLFEDADDIDLNSF